MGLFLKDLRILSDKSLKEVVLVDSESFSFCFQIDNGVPLMPWNGDSKDAEILHLTGYLIKLSQSEDIRTMNRERFKLRELANLTVRELADML